MEKELEEKYQKLQSKMKEYTKKDSMIAFSGGVDSSLLLKIACDAAKENGRQVYAVTAHTKLHPIRELEAAARVAEEIGAIHIVLQIDELLEAGIANNPQQRCYLCKKYIFQQIKQKAEELQVVTILEGTNEDDLHSHRPGIQAIQELKIISPLAEAGFTKKEVRRIASSYGLSVSDKPSTPCLATRFPYDTILSYERLQKAAQGEDFLKKLGFFNIRLRVHENIARIEVDCKDFQKIIDFETEIIEEMKRLGYSYVTLDLEGFRSGSMDLF